MSVRRRSLGKSIEHAIGIFITVGIVALQAGHAFAQTTCFEDLDGDGFGSTNTVTSADNDCADPGESDFSSDCNDEDPTGSVLETWFPDCDGDRVFSYPAIDACGESGANVAFSCNDGLAPDGGWTTVLSRYLDCDDEDPDAAYETPFWPDCDGDGVPGYDQFIACGFALANELYRNCEDGLPPDGGMYITEGSDCDDEDPAAITFADWYIDCDGDGFHRENPVFACSVLKLFDTCEDTLPPDGGGSLTPSTFFGPDCNDEDANIFPGNAEVCDNQDNNCNARTDESGVCIPGARYRLAFVTSSLRDATSTDIADYNAFVSSVAAGDPDLAALPTTWTAVVSTASVDARDNTDTNPNVAAGVPIFLVDGSLLASDNADFWDGSINLPLAIQEDGAALAAAFPYTGSAADGTALNPLGGAAVRLGQVEGVDASWISHFDYGSPEAPGHIYAISEILIDPGVPSVPAAAVLGRLVLGVLLLVSGVALTRRR